ncbi:hypothetical protein E2C01_006358 [Portunus trituberculatus]|uniref:Uncharacterized protein n=1 Tax=Portunus trituberculatus TaxID=210409 RepID=A0A5B7CWP2_PORTR|nr:hypothetical protein [Portunus trituberculatus]
MSVLFCGWFLHQLGTVQPKPQTAGNSSRILTRVNPPLFNSQRGIKPKRFTKTNQLSSGREQIEVSFSAVDGHKIVGSSSGIDKKTSC